MENETESVDKYINNIRINLEIIINNHDVEGYATPPPFFKTVLLNSYLYYYLQDIYEFFDSYVQKITEHECWFEINSQPLKWNLPFGINLELLNINILELNSPLKVIINFRNYPIKIIGPFKNHAQLDEYFLHSFKEAKLIEYEDKNLIFSKIKSKELDSIKDAVKNGQYLEYINLINNWEISDGFEKLNYPIKFFIKNQDLYFSKKIKIKDNLNLLDILKCQFPNLFNQEDNLKEEFKCIGISNNGVNIDLNFQFDQIYNNLKFYDSFLYLVINFN